MSSFQEKFVKQMVENSIGASFVFQPDDYRKGGGSREPCDLVWASNNCIILMCMTTKKQSRKKMLQHNMGQLSGWMDEWKKGRPLKGKNKSSDFNIAFDDYKHKILISVVKGDNDCVECNPDFKKNLDSKNIICSLCATITEEILIHISKFGGSAVDLINFLRILEAKNETLSPEDGIILMTSYHESQQKKAINLLNLNGLEGQDLKNLITGFRLMKNNLNLESKDESHPSKVSEFFNDLPWSHIMEISYSLNSFVKIIESIPIGEKGTRHIGLFLDLCPYYVGLMVHAADSDFQEKSKLMFERYQDQATLRPQNLHVFITIMINNFGLPMMVGINERPKNFKSFTELMLDGWN